MKPLLLSSLLSAVMFTALVATADPLGTVFTYQGRLSDGANPANGSYDLRFILYNADVGGSQVGPILTNANVSVSSGLFATTLDFGAGVFTGDARWLDIAVRTNGGGAFTPLNPRQPLTPAPYSLYAPSAGNAALLNGQASSAFAPASGSTAYVTKSGDTMTGALNLPANGLTAGGSQLVLSGGNVGIGLSNPSRKLEVAGMTLLGGDTLVQVSSQNRGMVAQHGTNTQWIGLFPNLSQGAYSPMSQAGDAGLIFVGGAQGTGSLVIAPWNASGIRMATNGNVGIGTPTPAAKLDVAGTAAITVPGSSSSIEALNVEVASFVTDTNALASHFLRIRDGAGDVKFIVKGTGDVGIGTASPARALEVRREVLIKGNDDGGREYNDWPFASLSIRRSDDFSVNGVTMLSLGYRNDPLYATDDSVANIRLLDPAQSPNAATSTSTTQLRIASPGPLVLQPHGGNVGIGTPNPVAKLEVQGGPIKAAGGFIMELRTNDPPSPVTGQMWLRTDL